MREAPAPPAGTECEVGDRKSRHDQHHLQLLGEEAEPDEHADQDHPPKPACLNGFQTRPDRGDHQQDEQRLGIVEPEHHRGDRGERQRRTGEDACPVPEVPARHPVEQCHRSHAHQGVGHQDRPRVQSEDPHRQRRNPQRRRRFVDRDRVRHIRRPEEPCLPRLRPGLDRRGVERVGPTVRREVPEVDDRRRDQ